MHNFPYVRIGCTYYKILDNNVTNLTKKKLRKWTKGTIVQDYGPGALDMVRKVDEFDTKTIAGNEYKGLDHNGLFVPLLTTKK